VLSPLATNSSIQLLEKTPIRHTAHERAHFGAPATPVINCRSSSSCFTQAVSEWAGRSRSPPPTQGPAHLSASPFRSRRTAFAATSTRSAVFTFCTAISFCSTSHIRSAQPVRADEQARQYQHHCTHQSHATAFHQCHCSSRSSSTMLSQACQTAGRRSSSLQAKIPRMNFTPLTRSNTPVLAQLFRMRCSCPLLPACPLQHRRPARDPDRAACDIVTSDRGVRHATSPSPFAFGAPGVSRGRAPPSLRRAGAPGPRLPACCGPNDAVPPSAAPRPGCGGTAARACPLRETTPPLYPPAPANWLARLSLCIPSSLEWLSNWHGVTVSSK
jgi:hypothetical protein